MTKVMFVCCNFTSGGVEQCILNLIDHIDRNKYEFSVLLTADRKYDCEDSLTERDVKIYKTADKKFFRDLINKEKIDIVHLTLGYQSYLYAKAALKSNAKKVIINSQTSRTGHENISLKFRIARKLMFIYANMFICNKTVNLACSDLAAQYLFSKKTDVEIAYNGIDLSRFLSKDIDNDIYNKYNIDKTKFNILHIGRMDTPKNPLFLVEVFSELSKLNEDYNLIYIGQGGLENEVNALIDKLGIANKITRIKYTNEVHQIMKVSDAFLLPSIYEGLPMVLTEAQASGLKCFVSTAVSAMSDCGLCKYISLEEDAKAWAEQIHESINSDDMKLSYEKLNRFSIEETTKRMEEIYG